MMVQACQHCKHYKSSVIFYNLSKSGESPNKKNELNLKKGISEIVDVSFPYYGRKSVIEVMPKSSFIPIISSSGCALIVRDEVNIEEIVQKIVWGIIDIWPMLIISYCIATLFGMMIWFTVGHTNSPSFRGIYMSENR